VAWGLIDSRKDNFCPVPEVPFALGRSGRAFVMAGYWNAGGYQKDLMRT